MPVTLRKRPAHPTSSANAVRTKISTERPKVLPQPAGLPFRLLPASYGLIQERICSSLYALVVQSILWNQTQGLMARPVLFKLLAIYSTPEELSQAPLGDLTVMLQPIGLQNVRAARLIALANAWIAAPPCKTRRYRKLHYPQRGSGADIRPGETLELQDEREGWEIAHLPGMGAYALDSYRIFYRDKLREVKLVEGVEPEWKKVVPTDKDLRLYLQWRWARDGWDWNWTTGRRVRTKG